MLSTTPALLVVVEEGDGIFVAAQPRGDRARRHRLLDRFGDRADQLVADHMAVDVVDVLEVVEVDDHHRHLLLALGRLGQQRRAFLVQRATIEQAGQRVLRRQRLGALLGGGADIDLMGEIAIAPPAEQDQREIEHHRDAERAFGGERRFAGTEMVEDIAGQIGRGAGEHHQRGDDDRHPDHVPLRRSLGGASRQSFGVTRHLRLHPLSYPHA